LAHSASFESLDKDAPSKAGIKHLGAYADFAVKFRKLQAQLGKSPPPSIISELIVKALKVKRPATRYHGGRLASPLLFLRRVLTDRMLDALILRAFR
jgi:hypothetical protein